MRHEETKENIWKIIRNKTIKGDLKEYINKIIRNKTQKRDVKNTRETVRK